jgi:hypothetical protein
LAIGHTCVIFYDVCYLTFSYFIVFLQNLYREKGSRSIKSFIVSCLSLWLLVRSDISTCMASMFNLQLLLFTVSDNHYVVHASFYGFWLPLCCPYFYLRFLITIMMSILLFTVSDYHYVVHTSIYVSDYHYVVHTSIYGFSLPLCCPYFYLRFLIAIMLSMLLFTVSQYHYVVHTSMYDISLPLCCPYFYFMDNIMVMKNRK